MISLKSIPAVLFTTILLLVGAGCIIPQNSSVSENEENVVVDNQTGLSSEEDTVSLVNAAIELMDEKGEQAFPEFRENDSEWFHNDSYVFVWQTDGLRVVYPPDPSGERQNVSDLQDVNGKPIGQLFIDTALSEEGEGWVDYEWPKPGETEPSLKHTFIKRTSIGNQTYLVGSGYYVD